MGNHVPYSGQYKFLLIFLFFGLTHPLRSWEHPPDLYTQGIQHLQAGRYSEAEDSFREALDLGDGKSPELLFGLSKALIGTEQSAKAKEVIALFLTIVPEDATMHHDWGEMYERVKLPMDALPHFQKMAELSEPRPSEDCLHHIGMCHDTLDDIPEAIKTFSRTVELYPEYYNGLHYRGYLYEKARDFDSAIADYSRLVALQPQNPTGYKLRGILLEKLERFEESLKDCDKLIELQPDQKSFYDGIRANLLAKIGIR